MTTESPSGPIDRPSVVDTLQSTERMVRQAGRDFLVHFYAALRSLKLYPIENEQVQRALDEVTSSAARLLEIEDELEVRVAGEFIFVNSTRLRLDMDNFASFSHVLTTLRQSGVGVMRVGTEVDRREWQVFISLLLIVVCPIDDEGETNVPPCQLPTRTDFRRYNERSSPPWIRRGAPCAPLDPRPRVPNRPQYRRPQRELDVKSPHQIRDKVWELW